VSHDRACRRADESARLAAVPGVAKVERAIQDRLETGVFAVFGHIRLGFGDLPVAAVFVQIIAGADRVFVECAEILHDSPDAFFREMDG